MIAFNCSLRNPWSTRWRTVYFKHGLLTGYKAWEFNIYKTSYIIDMDFRLSITGDHPGVFVMLGLVGYNLELNLYDTRHEDMR